MDAPKLDWSSAEVSDGKLTVTISGDVPDDWDATFARTVALLGTSGDWGNVKLKKGTVTVRDVPEGSEENLRFALDGAIQEANAHHLASDDDDEASDDDAEDEAEDGENDRGERDSRMTERFRDDSQS